MSRANKTRYALLGFLSMAPASGYDMKIMMEKTTDHFWKEGDASIYPILKKLLKEGLVSLQVDNAESGKPKKVYAITKAGMNVLQGWLKMEPESLRSRNDLMLKVFFGWNVAPEITINHLNNFRHKAETLLNKYRSLFLAKKAASAKLTNAELHRFLALKAGIIYSEASLKWCDEALQLLKKKRGQSHEGISN